MTDQDRIAIVGMAGRFPGARDVEQFWNNLAQGVCAVTTLSSEELAEAGVDPEESARPDYVAAGALLEPSFPRMLLTALRTVYSLITNLSAASRLVVP